MSINRKRITASPNTPPRFTNQKPLVVLYGFLFVWFVCVFVVLCGGIFVFRVRMQSRDA
jgi:hypothetical protein